MFRRRRVRHSRPVQLNRRSLDERDTFAAHRRADSSGLENINMHRGAPQWIKAASAASRQRRKASGLSREWPEYLIRSKANNMQSSRQRSLTSVMCLYAVSGDGKWEKSIRLCGEILFRHSVLLKKRCRCHKGSWLIPYQTHQKVQNVFFPRSGRKLKLCFR